MRVLVVAEQLRRPVPGGIGTYTRGLVRGLRQHGIAVSLLASRPPRSGHDPLTAVAPDVRASRLSRRLLTRAWEAGLAATPHGFDIVHAPSLSVPSSRAPLTVAVHDLAWRRVPEAFPRRGRRWHEAALGRARHRAAALLVPSAEVAHDLPTNEIPVHVLEPMYGCDHLPAADAAGAARLLDQLGVRTPYLLTVGTVEPRKNLPRLIEAYQRARPRLPEPWPLIIVGPLGWGEAPTSGAGVVMAGAVDDAVLSALYAGARCVAYVPLLEGFGLPAVEAMSAAVPVVASPMPSTGGAALQVDPSDVDAIADALVAAAADESRRAQLVTAGLLRAGELTWSAAAIRHLEVWSGL